MGIRKLKVTITFLLLSFFTLFTVSACEEVEFEHSITPVDWGTVPPASEFELEAELDPRASQVQEAIDAEDYQLAIELAIELYDIDISNTPGIPQYNERMPWYAYARINPLDGSIEIGPEAFASPGTLATTIGHEAVHAYQFAEGHLYLDVDENGEVYPTDVQGAVLNELEAWTWELEHAEENDLNDAEISGIYSAIDLYYSLLTEENRALADEGVYILPTTEP